MKYLDKLKRKLNMNKKGLGFIIGISIIGFLFGCFFIIIISVSDKTLVKEYITSFLNNIRLGNFNYLDIFKNTFINNMIFVVILWILGMSVIGIPVNIFYYFLKNFVLGFTISAFILTYKLKGCLFALIYVIPHNLINIFLYMILLYYSLNFSITLIYSNVKKKNLNFKLLMNKYIKIFIFITIGVLITSLYETIILPNLFKYLLK